MQSDEEQGDLEDQIKATFSANLREILEGLSVSQVARDIGMNRTQFNRYLYGQNLPSAVVLVRMCARLNVDERILSVPLEDLYGAGRQHSPDWPG